MDAKTGVALSLAVAVIVAVGAGTNGFGMLNVTGGDNGGDDTQPAPSGDTVSVNDWGVDGEVTLPLDVSSAEVYKFEPGVDVPDVGDYDDFSISDATSGLQAGVDYEVVEISNGDTATLSEVQHNDQPYQFVLVDNSDPREYHYSFWQESMPEEVGTAFAEAGKTINLDDNANFDQWATYGTDSAGYKLSDSKYFSAGSDLTIESNGSKTVTLERSVEVTQGVAYLGDVEVTGFNDGEGISEVDISVMVDGKEVYSDSLKDGSTGPLSDETSVRNALTNSDADLSMDPQMASDTVEIQVEVTGEFDTDENVDGDGQIGPGESIISLNAYDIFDNAVGDGSAVSFQG
ncbi:hypothetical protein KY092_08380 [Natronomonas gomsonensis]|uniref:hypothetical protein n=1 Tax=Natronomonas gomsonensis TaxID=1046043 RepID=UPI0020CA6F65|nr:hypothetical protein [Natronomonas gomsonensis]MCY4730574.1 hypothetical protein [Natronomonas gomsonensis]